MTGGIQVHAHEVHTALYGLVKTPLQLPLVHIMLILSYTDALRVDLHQFGQGIHESATDTYCPTHRYILIGELLAGSLGSGIDRGTVFAHHEYLWSVEGGVRSAACGVRSGEGGDDILHELLGFTTGRTITDGNGLDMVVVYHFLHVHGGLHTMVDRRVGEDSLMVQQVTLCIKAHYLTACTEAGVNTHHPFLS